MLLRSLAKRMSQISLTSVRISSAFTMLSAALRVSNIIIKLTNSLMIEILIGFHNVISRTARQQHHYQVNQQPYDRDTLVIPIT